eukprot:3325596-Pyramimonas_sp.AAC.1
MLESSAKALESSAKAHDMMAQLVNEMRRDRTSQPIERGTGPLPSAWQSEVSHTRTALLEFWCESCFGVSCSEMKENGNGNNGTTERRKLSKWMSSDNLINDNLKNDNRTNTD